MSSGLHEIPRIPTIQVPSPPGTPLAPTYVDNVPESIRRGCSFISAEGYTWLIAGSDATNVITSVAGEANHAAVGAFGDIGGWAFVTGGDGGVRIVDGEGEVFWVICEGLVGEVEGLWMGGRMAWGSGRREGGDYDCWIVKSGLERSGNIECLRGERVVQVCGDIKLIVSAKGGRVRVWCFEDLEKVSSKGEEFTKVEMLWEMDSVGPVKRALLFHDEVGELCLAIIAGETMWGLGLERGLDTDNCSVEQSFVLEGVLDGLSIQASRAFSGALDLLVLSDSYELLLYHGAHLLAVIDVPDVQCFSPKGLIGVHESHFSIVETESSSPRQRSRDSRNPSSVTVSLNMMYDGFVARCKEIIDALLATKECRTASAMYNRDLIRCGRSLGRQECLYLDWSHLEAIMLKAAQTWGDISDRDASIVMTDSAKLSAWDFLIRSEESAISKEGNFSNRVRVSHETVTQFPSLLLALHLLHEELRLDTVMRKHRFQLARLMMRICSVARKFRVLDFYERDYGKCEGSLERSDFGANTDGALISPKAGKGEEIPDIFEHLSLIIEQGDTEPYPLIPSGISSGSRIPRGISVSWRIRSPLDDSASVLDFFSILFSASDTKNEGNDQQGTLTSCTKLLHSMVKRDFKEEKLTRLPWGISLPLRNALVVCRVCTRDIWADEAFVLVDREDLIRRGSLEARDQLVVPARHSFLRIRASSTPLASIDEELGLRLRKIDDQTQEGAEYEMSNPVYALRFNRDRRLAEARRLLLSSRAVCMRPIQGMASENLGPDYDREVEQQMWLEKLLRRHLALPVGRGALTLHTFAPSDPTKPLHVPKLRLTGKLPGPKSSVKIQLDQNSVLRECEWPSFHNGVAAGLRLVAASESKDQGILTRSWIVKHKPHGEPITADHAGMLLGLGLGGYLPVLRMTDYYEYLLPKHDMTSMALMLGVPAGARGSKDPKILKMYCLHIPYFVSDSLTTAPEYQFSSDVQSSAMIGLGLLYQGSGDHYITEALLCELTRLPTPGNNNASRESTSLSAGIAIGLVALGLGSDTPTLKDLHLLDVLSLFIQGGSKKAVTLPQYQHSLAKTILAKIQNSSANKQSGPNPEGGNEQQEESTIESQANLTRETEFINVDITSSGAVLALTLMYLKTGSEKAAARLVLPESHYALAQVRPHHLLLRVMGKMLILWKEFTGLKSALELLPPLIRPVLSEGKVELSLFNTSLLSGRGNLMMDEETDFEGLLEARVCAIAGLALGLAVQHAGTGNETVLGTLAELTSFMETLVLGPKDCIEGMDGRGGILSTCLENCAVCLGVVGAGSGNLREMRIIRRVLRRLGTRRGYGGGMATSMALGFLFMGGGTLTFGNGKEAVASLICALYPLWPEDVGDNRYHLQALRHLYVLAIEPRCIEARDVDTGRVCSANLQVTKKNGERFTATSPTILPPQDTISSIKVVDDQYWPRKVDLARCKEGLGWFSSTERHVVHVKKRPGKSSSGLNQHVSKGVMAKSHGYRHSAGEINHLAQSFSEDPSMLAFIRHIFAHEKADEAVKLHSSLVEDCFMKGNSKVLPYYLAGERCVNEIGRIECQGGDNIGSLMILRSCMNNTMFSEMSDDDTSIFDPDYLMTLNFRIQERLKSAGASALMKRYLARREWPKDKEKQLVLGSFLRLARVPIGLQLSDVLEKDLGEASNIWNILEGVSDGMPRRELISFVEILCGQAKRGIET